MYVSNCLFIYLSIYTSCIIHKTLLLAVGQEYFWNYFHIKVPTSRSRPYPEAKIEKTGAEGLEIFFLDLIKLKLEAHFLNYFHLILGKLLVKLGLEITAYF